ncbi:hypothetical protein CsSME_00012726 [Camellia sinensis var. sinensis]
MPKAVAVAVAVIWTSTLQRTILTAGSIVGFPKVGARKMSYFLVKNFIKLNKNVSKNIIINNAFFIFYFFFIAGS